MEAIDKMDDHAPVHGGTHRLLSAAASEEEWSTKEIMSRELNLFYMLMWAHLFFFFIYALQLIVKKRCRYYLLGQFLHLTAPAPYFGWLLYTVWFIKFTWPTQRHRTKEMLFFETWLITEGLFFLTWLMGSTILLLICYLLKVKPFISFNSLRDADNNPWNSMKTSDWLKHMQAEYFSLNYAAQCWAMSFWPLFRDCAAGFVCYEKLWGEYTTLDRTLLLANGLVHFFYFVGFCIIGRLGISLASRRSTAFRILSAIILICMGIWINNSLKHVETLLDGCRLTKTVLLCAAVQNYWMAGYLLYSARITSKDLEL